MSSIPQFLSWLILSRLLWLPHSCHPQPELLEPLPTLTLLERLGARLDSSLSLSSLSALDFYFRPTVSAVTVRPEMDSAGADQVRTAMTQQGILLGQHATQLTATSREVDLLTAQVAELNARVQELQQEALASRSAASLGRSPLQAEPEPHANSPPPYDGDPNSCRAFLSQCSLVFALQPRRYVTEESQVETADLSGVPAEYHDLGLVFNPERQFIVEVDASEVGGPGREVAPDTILPKGMVVGSLSWDVEQRVREAVREGEAPRGCPEGLLFVPAALRSEVLRWGHESRVTCHPGSSIPQFLSWLILSRLLWLPHSCHPQPELLEPLPTLTLRQH
ncbi:hypothetical protein QQF64_032682 [Cirrhinus molitorella]|uniref:Uncharacterized protein n=1 Tax=Cirrhinus molitorella TaxID=172907 RepID=A0ABR3MRR8_9TELE